MLLQFVISSKFINFCISGYYTLVIVNVNVCALENNILSGYVMQYQISPYGGGVIPEC